MKIKTEIRDGRRVVAQSQDRQPRAEYITEDSPIAALFGERIPDERFARNGSNRRRKHGETQWERGNRFAVDGRKHR